MLSRWLVLRRSLVIPTPKRHGRLMGRGFIAWGCTICLSLGCLSLSACSPPNAVEAALHGDLPELKTAIQQAQKDGELSEARVRELARAVVRREVISTSGSAGARRIRSVRACASTVAKEAGVRAKSFDEAGAEAALLLLSLGRYDSPQLVKKYRAVDNGAWRAVAARAASDKAYRSFRQASYVDVDDRVRRAALAAGYESRDPADLEAALEVTRLDPDPLARSLGARLSGAIGGDRAVLALRDLYSRADESDRLVILEAWSEAAARTAGGNRELRRVAETETGMAQLVAALKLHGVVADPESDTPDGAELANILFVRALTDGTREERRLVLRIAPESPELIAAALKAAEDEDDQVKIMANARLLSDSKEAAGAKKRLTKLAMKPGDLGSQAMAALASVGDHSVAASLKKRLADGPASPRRAAAFSLVRLGEFSAAASALADDSPRVRTAVACRLSTPEPG